MNQVRINVKTDRWTCPAKCKDYEVHPLQECKKFINSYNAKQWHVLRMNNICFRCLSAGHMCSRCPEGEEIPDPALTAGSDLHPILMASHSPFPRAKKLTVHGGVATGTAGGGEWPVRLPVQEVMLTDGQSVTLMFDSGSQVTLISREAAERINATVIGSSGIEIIGIGRGRSQQENLYRVDLKGITGDSLEIEAHGISNLAVPIVDYNL